MKWKDLPAQCRTYLVIVYLAAVPFALLSFGQKGEYTGTWLLFTLASFFVATINLHLPQIPSVVISMGDVFTILTLMQFGAGPALLTYWANVLATALTGHIKRHGIHFLPNINFHRLAFNLSCCAISIWVMDRTYRMVQEQLGGFPGTIAISLGAVAVSWFLVNTATLSLAISLSSHRPFFGVWREGLALYLLNFFGSSAAAGLISMFYERASFAIFLLSLPVAVVVYQLYVFYIEKYLQARTHISELNKLYLQTIEAMANAVDAKDRYTHGHIRRVEAYATELAQCMGISSEQELMAMKAGALLHDIGKIAIPEYILNKPTVLTETEFEKMKIHPVVGANMLKNIDFPYPVLPLVKSHHERWDGNGYPDGLKGEDIPIGARILSLVDCYDALTTDRPYRSPMPRQQIIELFTRESGRAYDPTIVERFIANLERMEAAGKAVVVPDGDLWGIQKETPEPRSNGRNLERVQPTQVYVKALISGPEAQRELYSVFDFVRADIQGLNVQDVLLFIGSKLGNLIRFDTAIFYLADLSEGTVKAAHVVGSMQNLLGLTLTLEQKLSGWVAANNQALCNLPPFPDFLKTDGPKPAFQLSAIAPMNRNGTVVGSIALYRTDATKFSEEEFRRLEIIASQTATALTRSTSVTDSQPLFDPLTGLPNGLQLYLMFDQIVMDASRYEYPFSLFYIHFEDLKTIQRNWGGLSVDEMVRTTTRYLTKELRDTDLLVRYTVDQFVALSPKMNQEQAEALKSRLQDHLDHFRFAVRHDTEIAIPLSIGTATFPDDAVLLETLLSVAEWRMQEDRDLRSAVKRNVHRLT